MAKAPKRPEDVVQGVVADLRSAFGDELVSVILYGSAVRGDYRPGKSDINFFVVLTAEGMQRIERAMPFVRKWRKRFVSVPRFVTEDYIRRSLDSFPIEFLGLQRFHRTVYGEELLDDIAVSPDDLRLQCEREIKGKLLHLREGFLATEGKRKALEALVRVSLPTFASVFEAMVHLKGEEPPVRRSELFQRTAELFGLDRGVFEQLLAVREGRVKLGGDDLKALCRKYIEQIEKASEIVDSL